MVRKPMAVAVAGVFNQNSSHNPPLFSPEFQRYLESAHVTYILGMMDYVRAKHRGDLHVDKP